MPTPRLTMLLPTPNADAEEFNRISADLRTSALTEVLGVSRQMIARYRRTGAPASKLNRLQEYLQERAEATAAKAA